MNIEHETEAHRFVARVPEGEAELTYREREGVLELNHTFVPPEARGEGLAEELVETAFRYARDRGLRIRPICPYVKKWLEEHPDQQDLVAA